MEGMPPIQKILVACTTGLATCTLIARSIEKALTERGIQVVARQCKASDLLMLASEGYVLVVSTTIIQDHLPIPVVSGMPFLSGDDHKQVLDQIEVILAKKIGT
jgi:PTS system galactitol-specific IIB component